MYKRQARGSSLFEENGFMMYQKLITHIHEFGALAAAQLHMSDSDIKGMMKYMPDIKAGRYSPNQLRALLNDLTADYITSMPVSYTPLIGCFAGISQGKMGTSMCLGLVLGMIVGIVIGTAVKNFKTKK